MGNEACARCLPPSLRASRSNPSFVIPGWSKDQTSGAQLRTGESRDSGFDASHRPGMTLSKRAVDHDLDQFCSGPVECGFERGRDILWLRDPHRLQPERFCEAGEIDFWVDKIHADVVIVAMKPQLPLLDDPIAAIV